MDFGKPRVLQDPPFWEPFSPKFDEKIDAEIDAEKVVKIEENRCENGAEINRKLR